MKTVDRMNTAWQAELAARTHKPPRTSRVPLYAGSVPIGSVAPALMQRLVASGEGLNDDYLIFRREGPLAGWHLVGDVTLALQYLGSTLQRAGLVATLHNELLAVRDPSGHDLAAVERGIARLLGLPIHCVHLVGMVAGAGIWVQQRSMGKAEDPGLWDTLVGGTVAFGESPRATLLRELWEEAGLDIDHLGQLEFGGHIQIERPSRRDEDLSYHVDQIDCYVANLEAQVVPVNRDGEVIRFARLSPAELANWLVSDRFTLEAASVLVWVLERAGTNSPVATRR